MGESHAVFYPRSLSSIVLSFPWMTNVLFSNSTLASNFEPQHFLHNFLLALDNFEQSLKLPTVSSSNLIRALRIRSPTGASIPFDASQDLGELDRSTGITLLNYMASNRLVDVVSWVEGLPANRPHPRQGLGSVESDKWRSSFENWPGVLSKCRRLFEKRGPKTSQPSTAGLRSRCFALLSSVAHREISTTGKMKILANIEVAALHLAILSTGLLDIPDDMDWFFNLENEQPDDTLRTFLEELFKHPHRYRLPLHLSLMLTPLYLLLPAKLFKMDWNRVSLLQSSMTLGNVRAESLAMVEKALWRVLIEIVLDGVDLETAVEGLLAEFPESFVQNVDSVDSMWFSASLANSGPPSNVETSLGSPSVTEKSMPSSSMANGGPLCRNMSGKIAQDLNLNPASNLDQACAVSDSPEGADQTLDPAHAPHPRRSERLGQANPNGSKGAGSAATSSKRKRRRNKKDKGTSGDASPKCSPFSPEPPHYLDVVRKILHNLQPRPSTTLDVTKATAATHPVLGAFYDPYGKEFSVQLLFHSSELAAQLQSVITDVESFYSPDVLHLKPERSSLYVTTESESVTQAPSVLRSILAHQHIVMKLSSLPLQFNERSLETLKPLNAVINVFDYSYHTHDENNARKGTLSQILQSSRDGSARKITTEDIPMTLAGTFNLPFSSESYAWQETEDHPFGDDIKTFPMADIRWGSASTSGFFRGWQVAPNGFGLVIDVKAGSIWAVIANPKASESAKSNGRFSDISLFTNGFDRYSGNRHLWDLEGVLLKAGNRIILRPNTPYFLLTLEHAILHGSRYYCISTLQDTAIGLFHTFIRGPLKGGKCYYKTSHELLRRLVFFLHDELTGHAYSPPGCTPQNPKDHLPDLSSLDGLFNLASLYTIMIFLNAIHPDTYQYPDSNLAEHDLNFLSFSERINSMYARGRAHDLLLWVFRHHDVLESRTSTRVNNPMREIIFPHLVTLRYTLQRYKKIAEGLTDIPSDAFEMQLGRALQNFDEYQIADFQATQSNEIVDFLHWKDYSHLDIVAKDPQEETDDPDRDLLDTGTNAADTIYRKFHHIPIYLSLKDCLHLQCSSTSSEEFSDSEEDEIHFKRQRHG